MDIKNLPAIIEEALQEDETKQPSVLKPVIFGGLIIIIFIGGFFLWAFLSPLESSAIAPGQITVLNHRKTISHLEGGIVDKLYIKEGDYVKENQPLIKLEQTRSQASLQLLQSQAFTLLAQEARLVAERDEAPQISFDGMLEEYKDNPIVKKIEENQIQLFEANKKSRQGTLDILDQRIVQLKEEIKSLESQIKSSERQLILIKEELDAVQYLSEKGLIEKTRLLALMREAAKLRGDRDENKALVARLQQKIGETKLQRIEYLESQRKDILTQLHDRQDKLNDVVERMKAAEDVFKRTVITAPLEGRVVDLKIHTEQGVITPGEPLMDIVPKEDQLVIEAKVSPTDIDVVHEGLVARVHLTAYKQRNAPPLDGKVIQVSADSFTDPKTGSTYYKALVNINPEDLSKLSDTIKLYPGMPAQVMIISDKRTPYEYFVTPIKESFNRAFREQ